MLIRPALQTDAGDIDRLLDAAFGPGRHRRTASMLRTGAEPLAGPSLVARCDKTDDVTPCEPGALLGSIQFWPIALVAGRGPQIEPEATIPLTLLGPVAVAASARSLGLGRRLIGAALEIADGDGIDPILLIGDLSYYGRFGFSADVTGGWSLPGPVERDRLLLRQRVVRPLPRTGYVAAFGATVPDLVAADG